MHIAVVEECGSKPSVDLFQREEERQYIYIYKLFIESVAIPDLASRRPYAVASERSEEATYRA